MPSLTGQPALDVAIGLVLMFFLLSVICSAVQELIATALAWRSKTLLAALRSMLDEPAPERRKFWKRRDQSNVPQRYDAATKAGVMVTRHLAEDDPPKSFVAKVELDRLLAHPLISSLTDEAAMKKVRHIAPSYIPSRTFALALLDTLTDRPTSDRNAWTQVTNTVGLIGNEHLRGALTALLTDARGDVNRFRDGVEQWFDATMARASGWYKRRTQVFLLVIATVVTLAFNADAGQVGTALWKNPELRASVVAQAQKLVDNGNTSDLGGGSTTSTPANTTPTPGNTMPTPGNTTPTTATPANTTPLSTRVADVRALNLPLGWSVHKADPRWPDDAVGWAAKVLGLLATVIALSLGAPFWFDLLGRLTQLRGSGAPPKTQTS